MANAKTLRAKVKLDTKDVAKQLANLEKRINKIQTATNKLGKATALSQNIQKSTNNMNRLNSAIKTGTQHTNQLAKGFQKSSSAVSTLTKNLKTMISTYVGIMGVKAVAGVSDKLTSAQNQLNNLSGGNPKLTQETLDKTYAAAQRSRGGYTDMLSNVGKTMTLAGDSFQNNVDNAIRFQEIMSKAYTVGGSSAAEQSASMYQLVQALGSGVLQGDELRSLREGASLMYKEIERFAQGVLNTDESLKDLASKGVITSDIVVAAVMNAEDKINKSFENTEMTFAQACGYIKNMSVQAFRPVLDMLNEMLNSDTGRAIIDGIGQALVFLANTVMWLFDVLGTFFNWFAENWDWIKYIVIGVMTALIAYWLYYVSVTLIGIAIQIGSWIALNWQMLLVLIIIGALVGAIVWWANTAKSGIDFVIGALAILGAAIGIISILAGNWILLIVGLVIMLAAIIIQYLDYVMGSLTVAGDFIIALVNSIIGIILAICAILLNAIIGIINSIIQVAYSAAEPIIGVVEWIVNACNDGFNSLGGTCANLIGQIISWFLSLGKVVTKIIDAILGTNWTGGLNSLQDKVLKWGKKENAVTLSREAPEISRIDVTDAYNTGASLLGVGTDLFNFDLKQSWNTGFEYGTGLKNKIDSWGSGLQNKVNNFNLGKMLKTGSSDAFSAGNMPLNPVGSGLLDPNDPAYSLGGGYDPSAVDDDVANALKKLGDIDDNTGSMADSMKLADEDLEYLRKLAESEWKKEFTTAEIHVDMSNYNTVNGETDLDGIVTKLSDKLYEELDAVANGVYA